MRIRTIKPEFFLHERLFELEVETKLPIRIAFAGLWCVADREGRFKWEPRKIGVQVLPYDCIDFSRVLDALLSRGFVGKYRVETVDYGWIPSFPRHQVINNRERDSELPEPNDTNACDACGTREPRDDDAGKAEGKGKEGKGKELLSDKIETLDSIKHLWSIFPPTSRNRSSIKKLADAWKATKNKPEWLMLLSQAQKWADCDEWTRDGGQYAPGAHIWIKDRKWESDPVHVFRKTTETGTRPLF